MKNGRVQQNNYVLSSKNNDDSKRLFMMQHKVNAMFAQVSTNANNLWYVDLGALNHMTCHDQWFKKMECAKGASFV